MKSLLMSLLLIASLSGCGTALSKILPDDVYGHSKYYSGTLFDTAVVAGTFMPRPSSDFIVGLPLGIIFLGDLPISFTMDTVLLPFQFLYHRAYELR